MNKLIIGSMAAMLSFGAVACSSSSKSTTTTVAASSVATTTAGAASTTTIAGATGGTSAAPGAAAGPIGTKQAAVLAKTEAELTKANATFDASCLSNLIAQLTDADADLILSAVPPATVLTSPAGEALGAKLGSCVTVPTSDVVATT